MKTGKYLFAIQELWKNSNFVLQYIIVCITWIIKKIKYLLSTYELWKYLFKIHELWKNKNVSSQSMNYENFSGIHVCELWIMKH